MGTWTQGEEAHRPSPQITGKGVGNSLALDAKKKKWAWQPLILDKMPALTMGGTCPGTRSMFLVKPSRDRCLWPAGEQTSCYSVHTLSMLGTVLLGTSPGPTTRSTAQEGPWLPQLWLTGPYSKSGPADGALRLTACLVDTRPLASTPAHTHTQPSETQMGQEQPDSPPLVSQARARSEAPAKLANLHPCCCLHPGCPCCGWWLLKRHLLWPSPLNGHPLLYSCLFPL